MYFKYDVLFCSSCNNYNKNSRHTKNCLEIFFIWVSLTWHPKMWFYMLLLCFSYFVLYFSFFLFWYYCNLCACSTCILQLRSSQPWRKMKIIKQFFSILNSLQFKSPSNLRMLLSCCFCFQSVAPYCFCFSQHIFYNYNRWICCWLKTK